MASLVPVNSLGKTFGITQACVTATLILIGSNLFPTDAGAADRPNILWIYLEDVSGWFSCYGDKIIQTPHIDAMAERGVKFTRFYAPEGKEWQSPIAGEIARFLREPEKPLILALSRPDARKNITALISAYGEDPESPNQILPIGVGADAESATNFTVALGPA